MLIGLLASCNSEGTWVLERYTEKDPIGVESYATYKMNTNNGDVYLLSEDKWKKLEHK